MATPNVMVYGTFSVLGTELVAGYRQEGDNKDIFIQQDVSTPPAGLTIAQMIAGINQLMNGSSNKSDVTPGHFTDQLAPLAKDPKALDPAAIQIILRTVYLHIHEEPGKKTTEYAFRVDVDTEGLFKPDFDLIRIHQVTVAVWNTTNEKFTKQMALPVAP